MVIHSIKKGTLNGATNKYDYNVSLTSDDIKLLVTYVENGATKNLEVTPNSTGGFSFVMPLYDVTLKFASKGVQLKIYDGNEGTATSEPTPEQSQLSLGQFQQSTDSNGVVSYLAKVEGVADSKDKVVLNLSQAAYENAKRVVITVEAYGSDINNQNIQKNLELSIPVNNDGNGLYSFTLPDLSGGKEFEVEGGSGTLALTGLRIKYRFDVDKAYRLSATATTKPRIGTGTTTTPGTGTTTPPANAKLNVAETDRKSVV